MPETHRALGSTHTEAILKIKVIPRGFAGCARAQFELRPCFTRSQKAPLHLDLHLCPLARSLNGNIRDAGRSGFGRNREQDVPDALGQRLHSRAPERREVLLIHQRHLRVHKQREVEVRRRQESRRFSPGNFSHHLRCLLRRPRGRCPRFSGRKHGQQEKERQVKHARKSQ